MGFGAELGMSAAQGAVDSLFGLALGGINDKRQVKQQERLSEQQLRFDKQRAQYGQDLALQMWEKTNYKAQKEQMKKANLSPGLMYGVGGAGGGTVGGGQGAVSAPSAPSGGGEIMGMQLIDAQRKLIEAQTENIQEDTVNKAGFERNKGTAEARLAKNVAQFYVDTYGANYGIIQDRASILQDEAQIKRKDRMVSDETWKLEITAKEAELIGLGLANELKRAQKDLTEQQMVQVAESIRQKWEEVNIKRGHLDLDKFIKDVKDSTKLTTDVIFKVIGLIK